MTVSFRIDNLNQIKECGDCACFIDGELNLLSFQAVLTTPALYSLELTPICNNCCPGCSNVFITDKPARRSQANYPPLDLEGWRAILDVIAPHAQHLKLTGGEPTLHPQFAGIVSEIAQRDLFFTLFTNGRWRQPETLIYLLRDVPQCTGLLISLHGADAPAHEAFSGVPGSFVETVANIRRAAFAGLAVVTSTVITRQNAHQIAAITDLAQELGADHAVFNRYLGTPLPVIEPSERQLTKAVLAVDQLYHDGAPVRFGNCIPQCFVVNSSVGCLAGSTYATIDPWGNLRPCNHDGLVCGNLLEEPLESIWHGAAMNRWRSFLPEECSGCAELDRCRVGCRAVARQWSQGVDPLHRPATSVQLSIPLYLIPSRMR